MNRAFFQYEIPESMSRPFGVMKNFGPHGGLRAERTIHPELIIVPLLCYRSHTDCFVPSSHDFILVHKPSGARFVGPAPNEVLRAVAGAMLGMNMRLGNQWNVPISVRRLGSAYDDFKKWLLDVQSIGYDRWQQQTKVTP